MAVAVADHLPGGDRAAGPVLAQAYRTPHAHLDYFSVLRRPLFAADLLYRLQAARGRIGVERIEPRRCAVRRGRGRIARTNVCLGLFSRQPAVPAGEPTKVCDLPG